MKSRLYVVSVIVDSTTTIVSVLAVSVKQIHAYFGPRQCVVWDELDACSFDEPDFDLTNERGLGLPEADRLLVASDNCIPSFLAS